MFAAMEAFAAVAGTGGFAAAARKAGVATSSLTRQVDALEAEIGASLLNRSTRGLTLTPAGEDYLERVRRILADVEDAGRSIGDRDGVPRGLLRVSLPVAFARLHIAPMLPEFLRACPEVELELVTTDRIVDMVEERIDVAIRLGSLPSSTMVARRLGGHRRVVCAGPRYIDRFGVPERPADLVDRPCLTFVYGDGDRVWRFESDGAEVLVRVRGPLTSTDSETLRSAAVGGVGLVLLPTWLVGEDLAAGRLVQVLAGWRAGIGRVVPEGASEPGVYALFLPDRRRSARVRAFIDHLAARFERGPWS
jgi:DNA-binding transcriptional LysR family regulator